MCWNMLRVVRLRRVESTFRPVKTPAPLRNSLEGHLVSTAHELGWATLTNGDLLSAAEDSNFEIFITVGPI